MVKKRHRNRKTLGSFLWTCGGTVTLLVAWEAGSRIAGSDLIFPGPLTVLERYFLLIQNETFFQALLSSFWRVVLGIVISVPLGIGIGIIASLDKRAYAFFRPLFAVIAATPVMSVILIAFLALGAEHTPIFTSFLMIFPIMTSNTIEGARAVDPKLLELFKIYKLSLREKIRYLYIPSIMPFILGGLRSSLSLCWKIVVAAEILVQPARALGTGMQRARSQLETPELFAWTLATVIAAALSQFILSLLLKAVPYSVKKQKGAD